MRTSYVIILSILLLAAATLAGCAGGGGSVYYGHSYGHSPWRYHGGYVRDRVHVVSEDEIRALDVLETERALDFDGPAMDMGFGGGGFDGGGFDGGGFDGGGGDF